VKAPAPADPPTSRRTQTHHHLIDDALSFGSGPLCVGHGAKQTNAG
jgi:hypothetical protein